MTLEQQATGPRAGASQLAGFRARCEQVAGAALDGPALHRWSVEQPEAFWATLLDWSGLPFSGAAEPVLTGTDVATARFFPGVRLSYAEALLRPLPEVPDNAPALTAVHADRPAERLTRAQLRAEVARTAAVLAGLGLAAGDRVALVAPNTAHTVVAALAVAALGAAVSTATPDMGAGALLGRFEQVEPVLLLLDRTGAAPGTAEALAAGLPTLRRVLLLDDRPAPPGVATDRMADLPPSGAVDPWERRPFDTPLFVMFSSGTTGPPKAMVHGAGGTLLEHVKEHRLHGDLRPGDVLYFHTTTAWMMWNWQLSALAVGAHVVLYDGPIDAPGTLWELVAAHGVTVFGTSPDYLQLCQDAGYAPAAAVDLSRLRAVLSTGAVLHDWQFDWVAGAVGPVPLQSISGGTDIIGCFVLGSPELPVRRGRAQCRSLGLDVAAVDDDGREVVGAVGELVCRRPFPSRPLGFLRDPDGVRFTDAYFTAHPGMWTHGDLVDLDPDGSARLHGRSDGVLNVDGVRIGPAEIYTVLRRSVPEVADAMAVEQRDPGRPGAGRMVLLVVPRAGATVDDRLARTIRRTLREQASPAHVPSLVLEVPDLPVTHNGKRSERAARDALNGDPVANAAALRNPGCLDALRAAAAEAEQPRLPRPRTAAGPAGELPAALTALWREVLDDPDAPADPDAEFGDLGGTSRQVLSLLRRVRLDLGAEVPVQVFARRPTLRGLAAAVAAAPGAGADAVPVLRGGSGRPVFLLPDAWGQLNLYAGLVERLATERPVRGVQVPVRAADGGARPIEEVAADAAARIRSVQPAGPWSLAGYSYGGLVAFEVARLLRAAGGEVAWLGLLDVRPPAAARSARETAALRRAARWRSLRAGGAAGLLRRLGRPAPVPAAPDDPELRFFTASEQVAEAYRPGRFDGAVTYFLAAGSRPDAATSLPAWRRVTGRLDVLDVPGHHGDLDDERIGMLSGRHVAALAAAVDATLR